MKSQFLLSIVYFAFIHNSFGQGNEQLFVVAHGETRNIDVTITKCEKFIMNDNSTLIISSEFWGLNAVQSEIGIGCKIIANGIAGRNGKKGGDGKKGRKCKSGERGDNGNPGGSGESGKNISIKTNFTKLGNLIIESNGGKGGNGGEGGAGGRGGDDDIVSGKIKRCGGGSGGDGGTGGKAGIGGNGGNINIQYGDEGLNPESRIQVTNSRGNNGSPGEGGAKGKKGPDKSDGSRGRGGQPASGSGTDGIVTFNFFEEECLELAPTSTYALIIWVSNYEKPEPKWEEQAFSLVKIIESNYKFASITPLKDPSYEELQNALTGFSNKGGESNVLIYLSGHGVKLSQSTYGFLTSDGNKMSFDAIRAIVEKSDLKTLLFILDACYSGKILDDSGINRDIPSQSTIKKPELVCGITDRTFITAGYEEQQVNTQMTESLIKTLNQNESTALTASQLFLNLITTSGIQFKDRPSFGKLNIFSEGDFIFHHK